MLIWMQAALALILVGASAWTDHRAGVMPNRLTVSGIGVGLLLAALAGGLSGLALAALGAFVAGLVPLILFRMRAMGGGDVKLFFALGALLGAGAALEVQGVAFMIGAVEGLVLWYRQGELLAGLKSVARSTVTLGRRPSVHSQGTLSARGTEIRFGPAVFLATLVVIVSRVAG